MLTGLAMEREDPEAVSERDFYHAALPAGHPYRKVTIDEEVSGVKAMTRDDLIAFHKTRYTPHTLIVAVVGDVRTDDVIAAFTKYFGDWQGDSPAALTFPKEITLEPVRVVKRIPDKSEVDVCAGYASGLTRTSPDYYAAQIMNMILGGGGALNSRLGDVIRDQHGLAYTVYSSFHASTGAGPWYATLGVNPANTDKAIALLKTEIARMRDKGVSEQEVRDAVAYLTGAHAIVLESNSALASELMDAEYFRLGLDAPEQFSARYRAVTQAQVNAAARKYLHPDKLIISIAGSYGE